MGTEYEISEADRAALAGMDALIMKEEQEEEQRRQAVLAEVKSVVSGQVYTEVLQEIEERCHAFDHQIAAEPVSEAQDDGASWGTTFVNQITNGGYTGDMFGGTLSIPLGDGRFPQFGCSM